MNKDDFNRFRHMLEAAKEVLQFTHRKTKQDLYGDILLQRGVVKSIEIIGEAAAKITVKERKRFPNIPWDDIIGMRNRLTHAYFEIDLEQVWTTVTLDIPPLREQLDVIVGEYWME